METLYYRVGDTPTNLEGDLRKLYPLATIEVDPSLGQFGIVLIVQAPAQQRLELAKALRLHPKAISTPKRRRRRR